MTKLQNQKTELKQFPATPCNIMMIAQIQNHIIGNSPPLDVLSATRESLGIIR